MQMTTYKLLRKRGENLYPLYVDASTPMPIGVWLQAKVGPLTADQKHVKSRIGALALRPGFHSTQTPFCDWIGKRGEDGKLYQAPNTVWCECTVDGLEVQDIGKNGLKDIPDGWYRFKTNAKQVDPWIISNQIKINRVLTSDEVVDLCLQAGLTPQPIWNTREKM